MTGFEGSCLFRPMAGSPALQHGRRPGSHLAPTWGGDGKWFYESLGGGGRTHRLGKTSTRKGGNLVEYADEDPAIREMFLPTQKNGVDSKMPAAREDE